MFFGWGKTSDYSEISRNRNEDDSCLEKLELQPLESAGSDCAQIPFSELCGSFPVLGSSQPARREFLLRPTGVKFVVFERLSGIWRGAGVACGRILGSRATGPNLLGRETGGVRPPCPLSGAHFLGFWDGMKRREFSPEFAGNGSRTVFRAHRVTAGRTAGTCWPSLLQR